MKLIRHASFPNSPTFSPPYPLFMPSLPRSLNLAVVIKLARAHIQASSVSPNRASREIDTPEPAESDTQEMLQSKDRMCEFQSSLLGVARNVSVLSETLSVG